MSAAFVQVKSAQSTAVSSLTSPSMVSTSGNLLVTGVATSISGGNNAGSPLTSARIADHFSNPWSDVAIGHYLSGSTAFGGVFSSNNIIGGSGHTVTFTPFASAICAITVAEFSGIDPASTFELASVSAVSVLPYASGPVTITAGPKLAIGFGTVSNGAFNPPASLPGLYTDAVSLADGSPEGVLLSYRVVNQKGAYSFDYAAGYTNNDVGGIATFKGTAPAFVQAKSAQTSGATTITAPSMNTTTGHFLAVSAASFTITFSGSPVSDSLSNVWLNAWHSGGGACYYAQGISGTAGHTVTLAPGGSSACAFGVAEFSGVYATDALDQSVVGTTSGNAVRTVGPTPTTTRAVELIIGGSAISHGSGIAYSTDNDAWTDIAALPHVVGGAQGLILSYQVASAGSYEYKFTAGSADASPHIEAGFIATFDVLAPPGEPIDAPAAGDSLATATVPLFYCELQTSTGTRSYSWVDQPINDASIQRQPRIVNISTLRRELSDLSTGRLAINGGSITLTDYNGSIRAMIASREILRKQLDIYGIDDANRRIGGVAFRAGQYLITEAKAAPDMTAQLTFEDRFGGDTLRDLLTKPVPFRMLSRSFNATLPVELEGLGEPIPYGGLSDEATGFSTVQVWYTGTETAGGSDWYEGLIAGCATSGVISMFGWDGVTNRDDGSPLQVELDTSLFDTDIAVAGLGSLWSLFSATPYKVKNGRRYTTVYLKVGSAAGEAFKLFSTSGGSDGVPVHVNLQGIEAVGDSTGDVVISLPRQWFHLMNQFVEQNHTTNADWYSPALSSNTPAYPVVDQNSVEIVKGQSEARIPGGYIGAMVIGFDLQRGPLGDVLQRICLGGDFDMGVNRHGQAFISMEDASLNPIKSFTVYNVLQDSYQVHQAWDSAVNTVTYDTIKNYLQTNASVDLRPSSGPQPAAWLTATRTVDDGSAIAELGGDPAGRREMHYEDWATRDTLLRQPEDVAGRKLARLARIELHQLETDLSGLDIELGDYFEVTHYAGVVATTKKVRCTAIELEPPDPFNKSWAVRLFGYTVGASAPAVFRSLLVLGGSGGGIHEVGAIIDIEADPPLSDQTFDAWIGETGGIEDLEGSPTSIEMPATDAVIQATYKPVVDSSTVGVVAASGHASVAIVGNALTTPIGAAAASSAASVAIVGRSLAESIVSAAGAAQVAIGPRVDVVSTSSVSVVGASVRTSVVSSTGTGTALAVGRAKALAVASASGHTAMSILSSSTAPGQVRLAWNANPSEDAVEGYVVQWGTAPGAYTNSRDAMLVTSYTVTGLTPGTTYYFSVEAYQATRYSGDSIEVSAVAS